jgi:PAS domain-containing protein
LEEDAMPHNPSYDELEKRIRVLEEEILEHKSADKALQESEEKYSRLFRYSNDGTFLHDLDGNILGANHKVLALFGYTNVELSTIKIPELHPEEVL